MCLDGQVDYQDRAFETKIKQSNQFDLLVLLELLLLLLMLLSLFLFRI